MRIDVSQNRYVETTDAPDSFGHPVRNSKGAVVDWIEPAVVKQRASQALASTKAAPVPSGAQSVQTPVARPVVIASTIEQAVAANLHLFGGKPAEQVVADAKGYMRKADLKATTRTVVAGKADRPADSPRLAALREHARAAVAAKRG